MPSGAETLILWRAQAVRQQWMPHAKTPRSTLLLVAVGLGLGMRGCKARALR